MMAPSELVFHPFLRECSFLTTWSSPSFFFPPSSPLLSGLVALSLLFSFSVVSLKFLKFSSCMFPIHLYLFAWMGFHFVYSPFFADTTIQ